MEYRERRPDVSFTIPRREWRGDELGGYGEYIDRFLLGKGVMLSEYGARYRIITDRGGEATYHVEGNTVLVRCTSEPDYIVEKRRKIEIFVEGSDKPRLVEELEQLSRNLQELAKVKV